MRPSLMLFTLPLLIAACGSRDHGVTTNAVGPDGKKVVSGLSIDTDAFKANVEIPGLQVSGENMDIDGIKLYPGSTVRGVKVAANDANGTKAHSVAFDFISPAGPEAVAKHLIEQAEHAGFSVLRAPDLNGAAVLEGRKDKAGDNNHFRFVLKATGAQTDGNATIDGDSA